MEKIVEEKCPKCLGLYLEVPSHSRHSRATHLSISGDGYEDGSVVLNFQDLEPEEAYDGQNLFDSPRLFTEMVTLSEEDEPNVMWKEAARWVRFEEDVEVGGQRWSKPRVSTLNLHSFFELRSFVASGTIAFDILGDSIEGIFMNTVNNPSYTGCLSKDEVEKVCETLQCNCVHLFEILKNEIKVENESFTWRICKCLKKLKTTEKIETEDEARKTTLKVNKQFLKKLPDGSEVANILIGEVKYLKRDVCFLIRLKNAINLRNLTEVDLPTRFLFIALGPMGEFGRLSEIGRCVATLLSDEVFREVAYNSQTKSHILAGMDEFLDAGTLLPPGEWDPDIRIEPPDSAPTKETRQNKKNTGDLEEEDDGFERREAEGLVRTGKLFGGLINDIKRKLPLFRSDFTDGFSLQSLGTIFFLYFACLAPIVTFGGVLGETTKGNISVMEGLLAGLISGVVIALFSGQPLTLMGITGPILVLETTVYELSLTIGWDHLAFRFWIGLWSALILLIVVATDASAIVSYFTKFTSENFCALVALIFMYTSIHKMLTISEKFPMRVDVNKELLCNCTFGDTNETFPLNITDEEECWQRNGTLSGEGCERYYPDVFLLCLILFLGTFLVSLTLKNFKNGNFLSMKVRCFISDFAVIIAILSMSAIDYTVGLNSPKLVMPPEFKPTLPSRGWIVDPFNGNPWWSALVAALPAIFASMLMFMDQHITVVFVNRKEHKLKKGVGYHLDLFIVTILITINSTLGLPWVVSDTVCSTTHVNALKLVSECAAPGERPQFLGVRENRLTNLVIYCFIGLSVVMAPILNNVPMAVLYGVLLYMGISAIMGLQLFDRIMLSCMPAKYQPDYMYLRKIPIKRVHLYTCIQFLSLMLLYLLRSFKATSILFPLMLVLMMAIRKLLDKVFTQRELKILDELLPGRKEKEEKKLDLVEDKSSDNLFHNKKNFRNSISPASISDSFRTMKDDHYTPHNSFGTSRSSANSNKSHCRIMSDSETVRQSRIHSILDPIFGQHSYEEKAHDRIRRTLSEPHSNGSALTCSSLPKRKISEMGHKAVCCTIVDNGIKLPSHEYWSEENSRESSAHNSKRSRKSFRALKSEIQENKELWRYSMLDPIFAQHSYENEQSPSSQSSECEIQTIRELWRRSILDLIFTNHSNNEKQPTPKRSRKVESMLRSLSYKGANFLKDNGDTDVASFPQTIYEGKITLQEVPSERDVSSLPQNIYEGKIPQKVPDGGDVFPLPKPIYEDKITIKIPSNRDIFSLPQTNYEGKIPLQEVPTEIRDVLSLPQNIYEGKIPQKVPDGRDVFPLPNPIYEDKITIKIPFNRDIFSLLQTNFEGKIPLKEVPTDIRDVFSLPQNNYEGKIPQKVPDDRDVFPLPKPIYEDKITMNIPDDRDVLSLPQPVHEEETTLKQLNKKKYNSAVFTAYV